MFQELIKPEVKENLNQLKANVEFLNEMVDSLRNTFEVSIISNKRDDQYKITVEVGKDGNYYSRRKNLVFRVTNEGIVFTSEIWYPCLKRFDMEQYYEQSSGDGYGEYKVKGSPPKFATMKMRKNTSCGNSYEFTVLLNRTDKDLTDKLKFIMDILDANSFVMRLK